MYLVFPLFGSTHRLKVNEKLHHEHLREVNKYNANTKFQTLYSVQMGMTYLVEQSKEAQWTANTNCFSLQPLCYFSQKYKTVFQPKDFG